MAKYDAQLAEFKNLLPNAKNILIALPKGANIDKLASGLSLFLSLEAAGREVSIVSDDAITVSQSHLFGVDHIQNKLPQLGGGNLTLTLEGVASADNTIPSLEKLDWSAQGGNLNLVFHVLAGQSFQPTKIVPKYQGSGFDAILVVGATNLNSLGVVYEQNQDVFSGTHLINIAADSGNTGFGQTNVVDSQVSSVSEIMVNVLSDLGFTLDADTASNLLVGIFESTADLTDPKVTAETYMAVANCLRAGGKKPAVAMGTQQPAQPQYDLSALMPKEPSNTSAPISVQAKPAVQPIEPAPAQVQNVAGFTTPTVVPSPTNQTAASVPSPEERPFEEGVISETPEPDWLTPKIFKGSSLG